jgi:hypothetical protein
MASLSVAFFAEDSLLTEVALLDDPLLEDVALLSDGTELAEGSLLLAVVLFKEDEVVASFSSSSTDEDFGKDSDWLDVVVGMFEAGGVLRVLQEGGIITSLYKHQDWGARSIRTICSPSRKVAPKIRVYISGR